MYNPLRFLSIPVLLYFLKHFDIKSSLFEEYAAVDYLYTTMVSNLGGGGRMNQNNNYHMCHFHLFILGSGLHMHVASMRNFLLIPSRLKHRFMIYPANVDIKLKEN